MRVNLRQFTYFRISSLAYFAGNFSTELPTSPSVFQRANVKNNNANRCECNRGEPSEDRFCLRKGVKQKHCKKGSCQGDFVDKPERITNKKNKLIYVANICVLPCTCENGIAVDITKCKGKGKANRKQCKRCNPGYDLTINKQCVQQASTTPASTPLSTAAATVKVPKSSRLEAELINLSLDTTNLLSGKRVNYSKVTFTVIKRVCTNGYFKS